MGAWGSGTFDNDTACDWSYRLEDAEDLSLVIEAVDAVLEVGDDYLDVDLGSEGLAACEVIAGLKGKPGERSSYSRTVDDWVQANPMVPPKDLVDRAVLAIDRVQTEPSELLELWNEGGPNSEWHAAVKDLRDRVQG
jgi:hypothetical protein